MRPLLRWAFNGTALASAMLFVAMCILWVRSYRRADTLSRFDAPTSREYWVLSSRGRLFFGTMDSNGEVYAGFPMAMGIVLSEESPCEFICEYNWFGFGWSSYDLDGVAQGIVI